MRLNAVNSRDIVAAGYDRDSSELCLQYKDGTLVTFHGVPFQKYQDFIEAPWKGRFVKKQLTGFFVQTQKSPSSV